MCGLIIDPPPPLREAVTSSCGAVQGEGDSRKPPLRCGKKAPWWCQSQGCSSSLADLKLMHPCDQVVIGRRVVHDQVQLAG